MSSIMRRRNGLIAWSVMGRLLSGVRVATPHLQTGRASYLSPHRAIGGGALPRERFSPMTHLGHWVAAFGVDLLPFLTLRPSQSVRLEASKRFSLRGDTCDGAISSLHLV